MASSRREALLLGLGAAGTLGSPAASAQPVPPACAGPGVRSGWSRGPEGQRRPDLGDGRYLNPVLSGDRPDPNVLKDGEDYYAIFSSFLYYPGAVIWRSRDLVNWTPVGPALKTFIGSVWALDLVKHEGRYFIYIPVLNVPPWGRPDVPPGVRLYVIHADRIEGPWSEPVDLKVQDYIDPGHVVGEDGRRYLFLAGGARVRLTDDGLKADGPVEHVYDGWPIPEEWAIETFALEGPKLMRRNGWFYAFWGEGGTAGPPTSHMVVVARSRSVHGPWENCPHNPIVHTTSREEAWWSRGHATPVEGPGGDWFMAYHGYENGMRTLGRQMLLEPFEWTADGWPRARGDALPGPLAKPGGARAARPAGQPLSDDFDQLRLGSKLAFYTPRPGYLERARLAGGAMAVAGQGTGPADCSPLAFIAGDRSYEISIELEVSGAAQGGLLLFYNEKLFCGHGFKDGRLHAYHRGEEPFFQPPAPLDGPVHLRVVNDEDVATFFHSRDGENWTKTLSLEVSGYNHNMGDGFLSLRPALFAAGQGEVTFRRLRYRAPS